MTVTKTFVDSSYTSRNRKRIEQDEEELNKLMARTSQPETEEEEEEVKPQAKEEPQTEAEPTDPEEKSFKKRYGDLRRHLAEKEREWESKFEELKASVEGRQVLPPKSDEDIAAWASKYPDVAAIVETIATKKAEEKLSVYKNKFDDYERLTQETARTKALNAIRDAHDDFDDLRKSDEFHSWVEEQPRWVQDALYENDEDAKAVIRVLDLYKVDKGLTPSAKKAKTKEAASVVSTKSKAGVDFDDSGAKIYESQVAKMDMNTYAKNEVKIMEAIRKGNFVYDLSGGAR